MIYFLQLCTILVPLCQLTHGFGMQSALFLDLRLKPLYVIITIPFIFITALIVSVAITHCLPDISHFLSFPPLLYIWICAPKHSMPASSSPSQVSSSSSLIAYPISATFFPFLPFLSMPRIFVQPAPLSPISIIYIRM